MKPRLPGDEGGGIQGEAVALGFIATLAAIALITADTAWLALTLLVVSAILFAVGMYRGTPERRRRLVRMAVGLAIGVGGFFAAVTACFTLIYLVH